MGMDIRLVAVDSEELRRPEYVLDDRLRSAHRLSRLFCNLMWRRFGLEEATELDQIAGMFGLDVSPLYDMMHHCEEWQVVEMLELANSEEERQKVRDEAAQTRLRLTGNLVQVLALVRTIVDRLSKVADLPARLEHDGFDPLDMKNYFSQVDAASSLESARPNFGQDLRNFRNFLEYAKSNGVTSVGFQFT